MIIILLVMLQLLPQKLNRWVALKFVWEVTLINVSEASQILNDYYIGGIASIFTSKIKQVN